LLLFDCQLTVAFLSPIYCWFPCWQLIVAFMPPIYFCAASLLAVDCCFMVPVYFPLFSAGSLLPLYVTGLMKA